jgi:hypothetical protein
MSKKSRLLNAYYFAKNLFQQERMQGAQTTKPKQARWTGCVHFDCQHFLFWRQNKQDWPGPYWAVYLNKMSVLILTVEKTSLPYQVFTI